MYGHAVYCPESATLMPVTADPCKKCGYTTFSSHYHAAKPATRFLWWRSPAKPECIMLWCLRCGYQDEHPELVGMTLRSTW
jgi:hypothetical protein